VSGSGRSGGAGRVVVFLNFSTALAAIALVAVVTSAGRRRWVSALGIVAVVLCAAVVWPGVVDQADLDVRWVNAVAAAGVVLALVLTAAVTALEGIGPSARATRDRLRVVAPIVLLLAALFWIVAEAGFLIGNWPVLGSIYYSGEWYAPFGHARLHHAVHVGHHHGLDGTLLVLTAILVSRTLGRGDGGSDLAPKWLRSGALVFQSNRDGNWEVHSMMPPYGFVRRLTHDDGPDGEPALSPDGGRVAYVHDGDLYVRSSMGGEGHKVADAAAWPTWSPDGKSIAYEAGFEGRNGIAVAGRGKGEHGAPGDRHPAWSPNGNTIAYECLVGDHWHICLLNPTDGSPSHHAR
jgi:hypothetical protein